MGFRVWHSHESNFSRKRSRYTAVRWVWILQFQNNSNIYQGPMNQNYRRYLGKCRSRWRVECTWLIVLHVWPLGYPITVRHVRWLTAVCHLRCRHDDAIKWKHFPRYWPFARGIHRSPVNSPHKGQWRGGLMFSLIYAWINDWVNNHEAGDLRHHRVHYDVIVLRWQEASLCLTGSAFVNTKGKKFMSLCISS